MRSRHVGALVLVALTAGCGGTDTGRGREAGDEAAAASRNTASPDSTAFGASSASTTGPLDGGGAEDATDGGSASSGDDGTAGESQGTGGTLGGATGSDGTSGGSIAGDPGPGSGEGPTGEPDLDVEQQLSFAELHRRQQDLVGQRVGVTGKAFFVASCPPPGPSGQNQPCVLSLYLADPGQDSLEFSGTGQAIPLAEGGARVSCAEGTRPDGGCPGWDHEATYQITADVQHQVLGGRPTEYVQLDVVDRRLA